MTLYYKQTTELFPQETKQNIDVDTKHPFVIAAERIDWGMMFEELEPITYKGTNKYIGRRLDIRAHCGIYLLQSAYHWTDRFSEEMMRYHAPTRIFCGYADGRTSWIDHTRIEKFRNQRLGKEGAEVLNKYLLTLAKRYGFTNGKNVDMDTTVQEAGIAYPTEMNLMKKFQERVKKIIEKILGVASVKGEELENLGIKTKEKLKEYQFFAKTKERKQELIEDVREISGIFLEELERFSQMKGKVKNLRASLGKELEHLLKIAPMLLDQIKSWLETGQVAADKIISLYKDMPRFIKKGKVGKSTEIGRKWIINQYAGGFLMVLAPENPAIADTDCVKISLQGSIRTFGEVPDSYGTDRGMYSKKNLKRCKKYKIKKIGIQPKGQAEWEVDRETARELYCRRAGIEPRIGIAGRLGLKKSRAKTDDGDIISGQKAAVGFNLKKLMVCWAG